MPTLNATTTTVSSNHDTVKRSIKGLQYTRVVMGSDVPALFIVVLLHISLEEKPVAKQDIEQALGVPSSTMGRILQRLGDGRDEGVRPFPGLKLVQYKDDPMDWRAKQVELTSKGRDFVKGYTGIMNVV
jgi:hypothetical protein